MCPVCGDGISLNNFVAIDDTIVCPGCDNLLRLIELDPPELVVDSNIVDETIEESDDIEDTIADDKP